jgi:dihydrofolate synthase / folylpolyglutamate synthase
LGEKLDAEAEARVFRAMAGALPARFETHLVEGVPVVVDGGHNASGVQAALEAVGEIHGGKPLAVVFGVLRDKDADSMLTALSGRTRTVVLTRPEGERAAGPTEVSVWRLEAGGGETLSVEDPVEAVRAAVRKVGGGGGVVLVLGSFATAAPVLRWLRDG